MNITANQGRMVPITAGAITSTFAIFYLMQGLVASDVMEFQEPRPPIPWDMNIQVDDTTVVREIEHIDPPKPVDPPPETKKLPDERIGEPNIYKIGPTDLPKHKLPEGAGRLSHLADGEKLPLVRVNPVYPQRALQHEKEGWVVVEFTVTEMGSVENAVVIDAEPKGYFEKAALKAIAKFKYKPTVVDGQAKPSHGVRFRMVFEMTD